MMFQLIPQFPSACSQSAFQSFFFKLFWVVVAPAAARKMLTGGNGIAIKQFITNLFIAFMCVKMEIIACTKFSQREIFDVL